jgi:adenylylsulfate kinase
VGSPRAGQTSSDVSATAIPTLLLTGTVGSGKTAVAIEVGHLLEQHGKSAAVVDLDWLGWLHLRSSAVTADQLIARNLAAIWPHLREAGMHYAVLARAILARDGLDALRFAVPDADLTVVRLTASPTTIEGRLRQRDSGEELAEHLRESLEMSRAMDRARLEDMAVAGDGRSPGEVALEVLQRVGWIRASNVRSP